MLRTPVVFLTGASGEIGHTLIERLSGRINHIHLIDSDNTCHKDAAGNDETSTHAPFGDGVVDFESARIEEAQSEFVVFESGHSVQSHPEAIQEVRRILLARIDAAR